MRVCSSQLLFFLGIFIYKIHFTLLSLSDSLTSTKEEGGGEGGGGGPENKPGL
jgi:hypothetical protein